jgi:ATP-dependent DNA ligase
MRFPPQDSSHRCSRSRRLVREAEGVGAKINTHLESVVTKPRASTYRSGQRGWVKIKNRAYWRYEMEREAAINLSGRETRHFV